MSRIFRSGVACSSLFCVKHFSFIICRGRKGGRLPILTVRLSKGRRFRSTIIRRHSQGGGTVYRTRGVRVVQIRGSCTEECGRVGKVLVSCFSEIRWGGGTFFIVGV